jgi:spore coat protein U-like protein
MRFGTYTGAAVSAMSSVSVTCTNSTPHNVSLSSGLAPGPAEVTRKVSGAVLGLLSNALVSNSQGTVNWGPTVGADTVAGTGNDSAQALFVQGQVSAGQHVASSGYGDTIIVTVTY